MARTSSTTALLPRNATSPKVIKPKVLWWNDDLEEMHLTIKRLRRSAWRSKSARTKKLIKELRNTPWGKPYKVMVIPRRTQLQLLTDEVLLAAKFGGEEGSLDKNSEYLLSS
ncbi:hypothetical protein V9T40_001259 [Parthenolecanium corni]|uniref:Uncharacterized protein n=1 Tax=Parthenolecanium corni TaxID=536013 RepID=A0AAN9Y2E7_9HEMI